MKFKNTQNELSSAIRASYQAGIKAANAASKLAQELILAVPHDPALKTLDQSALDRAFVSAVYELVGIEYADQTLSDLEAGSVITKTEHARLRKCKSSAMAIISGLGYELIKSRSEDAERKARDRAKRDQEAGKFVERVQKHAIANKLNLDVAAKELAEPMQDKKVAALIKRVPAIVKREDHEARALARKVFAAWVKDAPLIEVQKIIDMIS